jgi:hypothetical protein
VIGPMMTIRGRSDEIGVDFSCHKIPRAIQSPKITKYVGVRAPEQVWTGLRSNVTGGVRCYDSHC